MDDINQLYQKNESKTLKKSFTSTYEDFFLKYPLVIGCNTSINILPPISNLVGGFGLVQKLSTKVYIGIKTIPEKKIIFDPINIYNSYENKFNKTSFEKDVEERIIPHMKIFLEKNNFHKGIQIGFLYEKGTGFGNYANSISLLATGLFLLTEKISHSDGEIKKIEENESLKKFAKQLYGEGTSLITGQNVFNITASILPSKEPLLLLPYTPDKKTTYTVSQFFGIKEESKPLDIDIIILNFGIEQIFDITKKRVENYIAYTHTKTKQCKTLIKSINTHFDLPTTESIKDALKRLILTEKTKTLALLHDIIKNPFDQSALKNFIKKYNDWYAFSLLIEDKTHIIDTLQILFEKNKTYEEEYVGICPFTTSEMGGSIMIISPKQKSRNSILKMLNEFKITYKYPFCLEYVSWEEEIGGETLKVEQDTKNNLYTSYFQQDIAVAYTLQGEEQTGKYEDLMKIYKKGIIFNTLHKKIFVNGKKVRSDEIFSQSFTIALFEQLLSNPDHAIANKLLEISSYSKYKNQLVGKIIIPLQKIAEKQFGRKIDINCTGENHAFTIKLKRSTFPLILIKKMM